MVTSPASHRSSAVLVLGSGFSADAGLPLMPALTTALRQRLHSDSRRAGGEWKQIGARTLAKIPTPPIADLLASLLNVAHGHTYEDVLASLDSATFNGDDDTTALREAFASRGIDVDRPSADLRRLRSYVAAVVSDLLDPHRACWNATTPCRDGHPATAWVGDRWLAPLLDAHDHIDIVTTNHDVLIENICDARGISWSTGTDSQGHLASNGDDLRANLASSRAQVRIAHVHGGVRWVANRSSHAIRDERAYSHELHIEQQHDTLERDATLVMGYAKLDRIRAVPQLAALWDHVGGVFLAAERIDLCGYGGFDEHMNALLALAPEHATVHVHSPDAPHVAQRLVEQGVRASCVAHRCTASRAVLSALS